MQYGINTLWVELLCNDKTACNADGTTFDGIPPFTVAGDISTPNPAYFKRADEIINIAAAHGVTILLDAAETDGWLATLKANGLEKAATFGEYLGKRYKDFPNISDVRERLSDMGGPWRRRGRASGRARRKKR